MSETTSASNTAFLEGVTTSDASARVQRVPVPVASPGACILCGKYSHPDGFAFFGIEFEFYGSLYFCADCAGDIANTFGWLPPDKVATLLEQNRAVTELNRDLVKRIDYLEEAVDSLTKYRSVSDNDSSIIAASVVEQTRIKSDGNAESELPASTESSVNEQPDNESDVSEPVTEQGTDDVPSTTGDESTSSTTSGSSDYLDVISELGL